MADSTQPSQNGPHANTCGNCRWGHEADATHVACFGAPPHPLVVGQRPAPFGRGVQLQFENVRPILLKTEPQCAVHKLRIEIDLSNLASQGRG